MKFRQWIMEMWYRHREECESWNSASCKDAQEYFQKHKWFLKKKYQQEKE